MSQIEIRKDFFQRQDDAKKRTWVLLLYFIAVVAIMIVSTYFLLLFFQALSADHSSKLVHNGANLGLKSTFDETLKFKFWDSKLFIFAFLITGGSILIGSIFRMLQLRAGGVCILKSLSLIHI